MNQKIRVGLATVVGIVTALASFLTALATQLANAQALGLDPKWLTVIGAAALGLTQFGRYLQAAAAALSAGHEAEEPLPPGGTDIEIAGLPDPVEDEPSPDQQ
jgi:hypothetical protein